MNQDSMDVGLRSQRSIAFAILAAAMALPALAGEELKPRDLTPVTWLDAPAHPPVEIVRDGQARAVVYVADPKGREKVVDAIDQHTRDTSPPQALPRLLHELVEVVRLGTGATLELVDQPPAADQTAIVVGDCEESRRAGIDGAKLPSEGFVVKTARNRVYLVGSTQPPAPLPARNYVGKSWARCNDGTAWAVADFLERFAGVRWYWAAEYGGRSVPRNATLVMPPIHYRDQPVFLQREDQRDIMGESPQNPLTRSYLGGIPKMPHPFAPGVIPFRPGLNPGGDTPDKYYSRLWVGSQQVVLWRIGSSLPYDSGAASDLPRQSGNEALLAVKADGSRDPRILCYSAPGTLDFILDGCERVWDKGIRTWAPRAPDVEVSFVKPTSVNICDPPDGSCHCPTCRATATRGGEKMIFKLFVKRLCEKVKQRWPDKLVVYNLTQLPKDKDDVEFPDNLVVNARAGISLGQMGRPDVEKWGEDLHRLGVRALLGSAPYSPSDWTYGPVQYPHVVQEFHRRHRDVIRGSSLDCAGENIRVTGAPTYYVWKRVLWNPELDVDATLDEMCRRLFGPGADAARELMHLQCDRWENSPRVFPTAADRSACRIPETKFREIWPADVVAKMKSLRDRALLAINAAGDMAARQAFLYWTWTFDAFFLQAQEIHLKANPLSTLTLDLGNGVNMKLVQIPAGEFLMGSPAEELWRRDHEGPQHLVRITKPFYMGTYEVTQSQWEAVTGVKFTIVNNKRVAADRVPGFTGPNRPVGVTWQGAEDFCRKLSEKTGKTVRLPTEAQWEYACRAGSTTAWWFGDYSGALGRYAVFDTQGYGAIEEDSGPQEVGRKRPNVWGLYDMHGNVSELVADWYSETYYKDSPTDDPTGPTSGRYRVRRGGSWCSHLGLTRSASRLVSYGPGLHGGGYAWGGVEESFRVVVEVAGDQK